MYYRLHISNGSLNLELIDNKPNVEISILAKKQEMFMSSVELINISSYFIEKLSESIHIVIAKFPVPNRQKGEVGITKLMESRIINNDNMVEVIDDFVRTIAIHKSILFHKISMEVYGFNKCIGIRIVYEELFNFELNNIIRKMNIDNILTTI